MSSLSPEHHNQQLTEQASEWLVKMTSDDCNDQDRQDFEQWQQQSPQHRAVAKRVQTMIDRLTELQQIQNKSVPRQIIEQALNESPKFKISPNLPNFIIVMMTIVTITSAWYLLPIQYWMADNQNKYDSWRKNKLIDQSEIKISGYSAYNLHFDDQQRVVELLNGNILVDVAKDAQRPFIVKTKFAAIRALGTRFMIHQTDHQTILTMLESKIALQIGQNVQTIQAGQQVVIDVSGVISIKNIAPVLIEKAWDKQSLAVENMPLDQVLDILQSYQRNKIYYNKTELQQFKVTAILPLHQQTKALHLLEDSLPIEVNESIPFMTRVTKK